jgi:DNA-binding HxlR family transcriptional regulator
LKFTRKSHTIVLIVCKYQNGSNLKNYSNEACPIARSIAFAGDSWCLLILRDAHLGLTRFDEFRKSLNIAPTMLTRRLETLIDEGLLEKRRYSERPPRDEYLLTVSGQDFLPILFVIGAWGRKHRGGGKLTLFVDAETDVEIKPVTLDASNGVEIGTRRIRAVKPT